MDAREIPARPDIEQYKKQAKELVKAYSGDAKALQKIAGKFRPGRPDEAVTLEEFRAAASSRLNNNSGNVKDSLALSDAQLLIAREHAFESWPKFVKHLAAVNDANSPVSIFERAADAIVSGDAKTLKRLLRENPGLIHERSGREHRSTLLHYVSANGVEDFRQKTPKNIAAIARILLDAGAEADAMSEAYGGGSTALNLTASSCHPADAGVMDDLIKVLLDHGAAIDSYPGSWPPIMSAISNHRHGAVETLARLGAGVDNIISAAAAGRLDLIKSFINDDGTLKPEGLVTGLPNFPQSPEKQLRGAFVWAGVYGRADVLEFLMQKGVDPGVIAGGFTALHWACGYGHMDAIDTLLKYKAPLEIKNSYGGTVLDSTLWFVYEAPAKGVDYGKIIKILIAAGARTDVYPEMQKWIDEALKRFK